MFDSHDPQGKFGDPISLPHGRQLVTFQDAGPYIVVLPKREQNLPEWQTLIGAAEGHDFLMRAQIGTKEAPSEAAFHMTTNARATPKTISVFTAAIMMPK
jgi:hypothetical protein